MQPADQPDLLLRQIAADATHRSREVLRVERVDDVSDRHVGGLRDRGTDLDRDRAIHAARDGHLRDAEMPRSSFVIPGSARIVSSAGFMVCDVRASETIGS